MTRYVWDKERGWVAPRAKKRSAGPYIMGDTPAYLSPLGNGVIDGRRQRREDMKRSGCREVDPSERPDTSPKSAEQLAGERAYMKARANEPRIDPRAIERLMRG